MFIKDKATHHSTTRALSTSQEAPRLQCSRANAAGRDARRTGVQIRLEGAPWLSLRDRCGEARPAVGAGQPTGARTGARTGAQSRSWRSLSRVEVAIALVLLALVSAVFRGVQAEPTLALTFGPSETPYTVAPISLSDYE